MNNPLISVALCTYMGEEYIHAQLSSILQQSYSFLEIIVVDDASNDGTQDIILEFTKKDARIRFYRNETRLGHNLNFSKACSLCHGEFIAIADQDDIWEKEKLAVMLNAFEGDNDTLLVHCISCRFAEHSRPSSRSIRLVHYGIGKDPRNFLLFNPIAGHNMLFRRKLIELTLPFPSHVYYDWWLAIHASIYGKIVHVEEVLVWHRIHNKNASGIAKPLTPFYLQTIANLQSFLYIEKLKTEHSKLISELLIKFNRLFFQQFSVSLFWLVLKHAKVLFAHKKRWFPWFSYTKHALRVSFVLTKA